MQISQCTQTTIRYTLLLNQYPKLNRLKNEGVVISRWYSEKYLKGDHKKYGTIILCNRNSEDAVINVKLMVRMLNLNLP